MSLSQSERLQQRVDSMTKYIHRTNPVDSSLQTWRVQARAGKVEIPQTVQTVAERDGCAATQTIQGKGTNMEYLNVLRRAESCAVCSDSDPVVNSYVTIPGCSTTLISSSYTAPCTVPGFQVFFPPRIVDGKNCLLNREWYGSHP
jgi:hypothetical protein